MNNTLKFDKYNINLAIVRERLLYIKLIDTTSDICYEIEQDKDDLIVYIISKNALYMCYEVYNCYENIFESNDIDITFTLLEIYNIINKSFNQIDGYNVVITINNGIMLLEFNDISTCSSLKIHFDISIKGNNIPTTTTTNSINSYCMNKLYVQLDRIENLINNINVEIPEIISPCNNTDDNVENPICLFNWNIFGLPYFNDSTYKEKIKLY